MKKLELKELIKECIDELNEEKEQLNEDDLRIEVGRALTALKNIRGANKKQLAAIKDIEKKLRNLNTLK